MGRQELRDAVSDAIVALLALVIFMPMINVLDHYDRSEYDCE